MLLKIELRAVAKKYRLEWVFRQVNLTFEPRHRYAVSGPNGSGKSTLMRILSGHLSPSRGTVQFFQEEKRLDINVVYKQLAYAAPYIELLEEFTLEEAITFHSRFKALKANLDTSQLIQLLGFQRARNKQIRFFSSGMKQRLKLALAICSDTSLLLLDEPSTNLDKQGIDWYLDLIARFGNDRTIIVASNIPEDYSFCDEWVDVTRFKQ